MKYFDYKNNYDFKKAAKIGQFQLKLM